MTLEGGANPMLRFDTGTHSVIKVRGASEYYNFVFLQSYSPLQLLWGEWKIKTQGYIYRLYEARKGTNLAEMDATRELISYHWHPRDIRPKTPKFPHLHLRPALEAKRPDITNAHIPTGRIAIETVVIFLIEQLGITPLTTSWRDIVQENLRLFQQYRTWAD